ncbi:uncharacterized protein LOC143547096 [Bidens hawaiensis]|uniref:uncharacterized protein LOC143547096 n=1 Tax=Bidens hawaiensis TaxID=980011 RepID=UPI00404B833F
MGEFCKTVELQLNQSLPVLDFIKTNVSSFLGVCYEKEILELDSAIAAKYREPMVLIGWYIAVASYFCGNVMLSESKLTIIMKKFWVPMELFSLNAASLTVISVAMKLPMHLTSPMPGEIDQVAKVRSLGFMCIIMSTIMPSLATMDSKSLVSNVTALSILVLTIVVNVGIQIKTQVITHASFHPFSMPPFMAAYIYMTTPSLKKVMERKYQATLIDQNLHENLILFNVEELRQLVKRHWIMAATSSPQFVMATTPLSSASSIICAISTVVCICLSWHAPASIKRGKSVYIYLTNAIYFTQSVGVVIGAVATMYRYFAVQRIKSFANQNQKHFSVFKVEKYWTQVLCDWKEICISSEYLPDNYTLLRNNVLRSFIGLQSVIVVSCKIVERIPIVVIILFMYCSSYFKSLTDVFITPSTASSSEDTDEDLSNYVLVLEDDMQLIKYPVKRFLDTLSSVKKFTVWNPCNNLLKLVEKSVAFEGVEMFDNGCIQSLLSSELVNSWSLPIISLTCIAIVIPSINKDLIDNLLKSVIEGLFLTHRVEASLNTTPEYINIHRATKVLSREIENKHECLKTTSKRSAYEGKTPIEIIKSFTHRAKDIVTKFNRSTNGEQVEKENIPIKVIVANSMYRIAQMIMHTYEIKNLEIVEDELFMRLSNMIADILLACLTNIPRVIKMKCREGAIEKREASVLVAAGLLEKTYEIIRRLETRELPNIDPEKMGFINEWRLHFKQP